MGLNYENLKTILNYILDVLRQQKQQIREIDCREFFTEDRIKLLVSNHDDLIQTMHRIDVLEKQEKGVDKEIADFKKELASQKDLITEN
jgi:hypothetical protein